MARPTTVRTVTAPAAALVALADARQHCRVPPESSGIGAELHLYLDAAVEMVDGPDSLTGVSWRPRGLEAIYRGPWPNRPIDAPSEAWAELDRFPLEGAGVSGWLWLPGPVPVSGEDMAVEADGAPYEPWEVLEIHGRHWLRLGAEPPAYGGRLTVRYKTPPSGVPNGIRLAVLAIVADMWANRGTMVVGAYAPAPIIASILTRYSLNPVVEG